MLTTTQPPLVAVPSRGTPGVLARLPSRPEMDAGAGIRAQRTYWVARNAIRQLN